MRNLLVATALLAGIGCTAHGGIPPDVHYEGTVVVHEDAAWQQLGAEIDRLEARNRTLKAELQDQHELARQAAELGARNESLRQQIASLRGDLRNAGNHDDSHILRSRIDDLTRQLNASEAKLARAEAGRADTHSLLRELAEQQDQVARLTERNQGLRDQMAALRADLARADQSDTVVGLRSQVKRLHVDLTAAQAQLARMEDNRREIQRLTSVVRVQNEDLETVNRQVTDLRGQLRATSTALANEAAKNKRLSEARAQDRQAIVALQGELTQLERLADGRAQDKQTIATLRTELARLERVADGRSQDKETIIALRTSLADAQGQISRMKERVSEGRDQLEAQVAKLETGRDNLLAKRSELERDVSRLMTERQKLKSDVQRMENQRAELATKVNGLREQVAELEQGRTQDAQRLASMSEKLRDARNEIRVLKASTSKSH